jgi:chromosome segregation ATPase
VELSGLELDRLESENPVIVAVGDVIGDLETVDMDASLRVSDGRVRIEELSTSADEAIRRGVQQTLERRRDQYVARARAELEGRVEDRLAELEPLQRRAAELRAEAERLREVLADRDQLIARKRDELSRRSRALTEEQQRRLEDEARDRLEDATEDLDLDGLGF